MTSRGKEIAVTPSFVSTEMTSNQVKSVHREKKPSFMCRCMVYNQSFSGQPTAHKSLLDSGTEECGGLLLGGPTARNFLQRS